MLKVLKEICYCGHPLKSHIGGQKKEDAGFWAEECYHCVCKRYIQDEQYTKQEEETEYLKTFPITFNGKQYSFENGKLFADGEEVYSTQKEPSSTPIVEECGERCMCCTPKEESDSISSCCSGTCKCHTSNKNI